jgi:SAM-dependent methyltransferase
LPRKTATNNEIAGDSEQLAANNSKDGAIMELRYKLINDVMAFWKSRAIMTGCDVDVFTEIDRSPRTAEEIAKALGLDRFAAERLLNSLAAIGLLEKERQTFHVTEQGALLSSLRSGSILPVVLHFSDVWKTWDSLTTIVKEGRQRTRQEHVRDTKSLESFIGAMDGIGRDLSIEIACAIDLRRFKKLLDIGGASGTYTAAFLRQSPDMTAVLFDLEPVAGIAEKRLAADNLLDRVAVVPGDFHKDELPGGCDLALLSAIIHQNSPSQNVDLFKKIHRALLAGGSLLIRDHIMDETRTAPPMGALFALNMLVATPGGDTYTFDELKSGLEEAGFIEVALIRQGDRMDALIEARKS